MHSRTKSSSSSLNPRFFPFLLQLVLGLCITATATTTQLTTSLLPSDAVSILSFKSKADLDNKLLYTLNERFDYCQWQGVKCAQGRVVRFVLQDFGLRGSFPPNTLSALDQLRVLSLQNNSLSGPIPDFSPLLNLKSLFLSHNSFSGAFPPSILLLHRLTLLDLAHNNFTGPIPLGLSALDRLTSLKLQWNRFNGTIPPLNQSFLVSFDVSRNNLTGEIPVTPTLSRFDVSSFSSNLDLCGQIINRACKARSPFFDSGNSSSSGSSTSPSTAPLGQSAQAQGGAVVLSPPSSSSPRKHNRSAVIIGFSIGVSVLIASILCAFFVFLKKHGQRKYPQGKQAAATDQSAAQMEGETMRGGGGNMKQGEGGAGVFHHQHQHQHQHQVAVKRAEKSGSLVFCGGGEGAGGVDEKQRQLFTLEQLMRASAELLGRGTIGTTYKAALDNQLIVTVKRLDASKTAITSSDVFERHMDMVGGLRHPNLVPIMAYFQAKGERLIIYEYQPNGSLFNLVHGSRSTRAKPLHWTSCLKIAEDVAQGLAYIHQASKLVHGNLKSSNVLLGADFEACITDYCVATLADTSYIEDPDSVACKAPETRKLGRRATSKSDVYAFGVLLLELLTGKHPSQHPFLVPTDLLDWVRSVRGDDGGEDNQLGMLTEVASVCSLTSPEQRPAMWQVLKMIQEIKDSVLVEDHAALEYS